MSNTEIYEKVVEIKNLQAILEEVKENIETLTDEIKAAMGDREEIRAGEFKVRWTHVESSRFDTKAFKSDYPELAQQYNYPTVSRRFSIA